MLLVVAGGVSHGHATQCCELEAAHAAVVTGMQQGREIANYTLLYEAELP